MSDIHTINKIHTVIWDCDGVMWFYKEPHEEVRIIIEALQLPYKMADFEAKEFEAEYFDMLDSFLTRFSGTKLTHKKFYYLVEQKMPILQLLGVTTVEFLKTWNKLQGELSVINPDTIPVLEYLQKKGIRNVIKSDWWRNVQLKKLSQYGLVDYFEELHTCETGYIKNHPKSTAEAIIKNQNEENFIIIGDSLRCDIAFANRNSIKSIWFNRDGKKVNNTPYKPTFIVKSLSEVMNII